MPLVRRGTFIWPWAVSLWHKNAGVSNLRIWDLEWSSLCETEGRQDGRTTWLCFTELIMRRRDISCQSELSGHPARPPTTITYFPPSDLPHCRAESSLPRAGQAAGRHQPPEGERAPAPQPDFLHRQSGRPLQRWLGPDWLQLLAGATSHYSRLLWLLDKPEKDSKLSEHCPPSHFSPWFPDEELCHQSNIFLTSADW